jgi:hypothetical protein
MGDERPRPQYGEYATPEQQAAAMGKTHVPQPPAPAPVPMGAPLAAPPAPTDRGTGDAPPYPQRQSGFFNRFFTVFLLGFGALTLFGWAPLWLNLASQLQSAYQSYGLSITVPLSVNAAGIPILIVNIALYVLSVVLSVFALRRGRIAFYIPVVGFVVFLFTASIIIGIVSPAFVTQVSK